MDRLKRALARMTKLDSYMNRMVGIQLLFFAFLCFVAVYFVQERVAIAENEPVSVNESAKNKASQDNNSKQKEKIVDYEEVDVNEDLLKFPEKDTLTEEYDAEQVENNEIYYDDIEDYYRSNRYILPQSSDLELTEEDINGLSPELLRYARNEIYARHGRLFNDETIQEYFYSQEWYDGYVAPEDFTDDMLSEVERNNLQFIVSHEQ